jgi:hypothetical protein
MWVPARRPGLNIFGQPFLADILWIMAAGRHMDQRTEHNLHTFETEAEILGWAGTAQSQSLRNGTDRAPAKQPFTRAAM